MNWTLTGLLVLAIAAVAALSVGIGYTWASSGASKKIAEANGDTQACLDAKGAADAALTRVLDRLAELRTQHEAMKADAERALDLRDAEIADLSQQLDLRQAGVRKAGKHDPQCLSLADLPVCPSVARELWPAATRKGDQPAPAH